MRAFPGHPHLARGVGLTILAVLTATCTPDRIPSALSSMATHLVFTAQPSNAVAGAAIGAITVKALDSSNNVVPDFTAAVTIAIANNAGGATLSGTTAVAAVAGVATFSNLTIDGVGSGYTLIAAATGVVGTSSAAFDITVGPATRLVCTAQPSNPTPRVIITPIEVIARDAFGNTATGFNGSVTVAIGTNPSGDMLSGTTTVAAVAGVATFSALGVKAGSGDTLIFTSPGLTPATCGPF